MNGSVAEEHQIHITSLIICSTCIFSFIWLLAQKWRLFGLIDININLTTDKVLLNLFTMLAFSFMYGASMYYTPEWWNWPASEGDPVQLKNDGKLTALEAYSKGIYFGIVAHSTMGFGDITPAHSITRMLTIFHAAIVILINFAGAIESKR